MVQWLGCHALTAEGPGSIPGRGTKIPQAAWHGQKTKQHTQKGSTEVGCSTVKSYSSEPSLSPAEINKIPNISQEM